MNDKKIFQRQNDESQSYGGKEKRHSSTFEGADLSQSMNESINELVCVHQHQHVKPVSAIARKAK